MIRLGGVTTFQWKTTEQIWPFEKAVDGLTLYCKEIVISPIQASSSNEVAHGIADTRKIHKIEGFQFRNDSTTEDCGPLPFPYTAGQYEMGIQLRFGNLMLVVGSFDGVIGPRTAKIRLIYAK